MTKLSEFNIIETFSSHSNLANYSGVGIGDDCAVLPEEGGVCKVVTTDTLTEQTHFILSKITPEQLAYKSLASNISDVIVMGAVPKYAFLSITFTEALDMDWIDRFAASFQGLAQSCGVLLLGGDTTFSQSSLTITITLIGEARKEHIKLRSGAKVGDKICVMSPLGGAALGLSHLLRGDLLDSSLEAHYHPKLFVEESLWLSKREDVGAMMDISDGIAKDLTHILNKSGVGADIAVEKLPIYDGATLNMALCGGEEYSPLFTVMSEAAEELKIDFFTKFGIEIYEIGVINDNYGVLSWYDRGLKLEDNFKGYEHGSK